MTTMSVAIEIEGEDLRVRTGGIDSALCLARELRLPRSAITDVQVLPVAEAKRSLGWRIGGGYVPGALATGWFTWRGRRGLRQWWRVYRGDEVLVIDTDRRRPARLVIQVDDPADWARRLSA